MYSHFCLPEELVIVFRGLGDVCFRVLELSRVDLTVISTLSSKVTFCVESRHRAPAPEAIRIPRLPDRQPAAHHAIDSF